MEGEKDAASGKLGKKTPRVSLQLQQLSRPNVQPVSLADDNNKESNRNTTHSDDIKIH